MKDLCVKLSGLGALLTAFPVMYSISKGGIFNSASYFLWALLALVCGVILFRGKKGGYTMMIGYVISDGAIGIYAYIKSGRATFETFEKFVMLLTALCAAVYIFCEVKKNFKPAVVVGGLAIVVAGIPQLLNSFQDPQRVSFAIGGFYIFLSSLGLYGEKNFEGKFVQLLSVLYWTMLLGAVAVLL